MLCKLSHSTLSRSLKTFVTANKPRVLDGRARQIGGYTSTENGTQESSSSSADNGEPQTPSPQYSEALPTTHHITTHESDDEQVVYPETMDPHFARLLSSLTLSAVRQDDSRPQPNLPPVKSPLSVLADTATPLAKQNIVDWSSRVSAQSETPSSPHVKQRPSKTSTPSMRSLRAPQSLSIQASPTSPSQIPATPSSAALSIASLSAPSSTSSQASSRKLPLGSRRTSSTADISPYLPRQTEVPASGKVLRQLALLESVADESSRMTPTLPSRELPTATNIAHTSRFRHPGPSASVPPPMHYPQGEFPLLMGQTPTGYHLPSAFQHPSAGYAQPSYPLVDDVFQVRPRSSQLFTHDCAALNTQQGQLLSLLTGSPPPPGVPHGIPHTYPHPSHSQGYLPAHYQPNFFPPAYQPPSSRMMTVPRTVIPPVSAQPTRLSAIPPSAPPSQASFPPPPVNSRTPVNNSAQLLSLLNNNHSVAPQPHVNAGYR